MREPRKRGAVAVRRENGGKNATHPSASAPPRRTLPIARCSNAASSGIAPAPLALLVTFPSGIICSAPPATVANTEGQRQFSKLPRPLVCSAWLLRTFDGAPPQLPLRGEPATSRAALPHTCKHQAPKSKHTHKYNALPRRTENQFTFPGASFSAGKASKTKPLGKGKCIWFFRTDAHNAVARSRARVELVLARSRMRGARVVAPGAVWQCRSTWARRRAFPRVLRGFFAKRKSEGTLCVRKSMSTV